MRLYHTPGTRSLRVLWALEEAGAPFELTILTRDERQGDEHRARHPLGRVPVLEEPDGFVFESGALCLHVADSYPDAKLIGPLGSHERALAYQWVCFGLAELEPGFGAFARAGESEPQRSEARERFHALAAVVESTLADRDFLLGDRFTIADVLCGELLGLSRRNGLVEGFDRLNAYLDRVESRPARLRADAHGADAG